MAVKWKRDDLRTLAEKKAQEVSDICAQMITDGINVKLSTGEKHFSLTSADQTNIDSMFMAVTLGAQQYPYHADGEECSLFNAEDIVKLYTACKKYVTTHTTYCNLLRQWIRRENDPAVLGGIMYGIRLPADLGAQMEAILTAAEAQVNAISMNLKR